jgi:hypothetical protein
MKLLSVLFLAVLPFAACSKTDTNGTPPHSDKPMDHGHGPEQALGSLTIGAHTFNVVQQGDVKAGAEAAFELEFPKDKPIPATVRGWIGVESGEGSMKQVFGKEESEPNSRHGHVVVPKTTPAGAKLWIEIEEGGKPAHGSIAYK